MPKKPKYGVPGSANMPGFPPNVTFSPQAAAQMAAREATPFPTYLPRGSFTVNGVNPYPDQAAQFQSPATQPAQSPIAQQLQGLSQQNGGFPQGPLAGIAQNGFFPQQSNQTTSNPSMPVPTARNTALPQGQVMHPSGRQRGNVGRFFLGSRPQVYNNPLYNQYQNEALNYLTQYGLGGLDYLDQNQFDYAPIGNQELERFYTQTIPSLAERFTAMGDGQRSSAFQGALGNAGRFLANDLSAQQQQFGLQQQGMNQNLYTNLLSLGLRPQFESNLQPGRGGVLPGLINAGAQIAGTALRGGF